MLHCTLVQAPGSGLARAHVELSISVAPGLAGRHLQAALARRYGTGDLYVRGRPLTSLSVGEGPLVNGAVIVDGFAGIPRRPGACGSAAGVLVLAVHGGPAAGTTITLTRGRFRIGRCGTDIVIPDAGLSRSHALLDVSDAAVTLTDLDSANGTFVDGRKIRACAVTTASTIRCGDSTLSLALGSGPAPSGTAAAGLETGAGGGGAGGGGRLSCRTRRGPKPRRPGQQGGAGPDGGIAAAGRSRAGRLYGDVDISRFYRGVRGLGPRPGRVRPPSAPRTHRGRRGGGAAGPAAPLPCRTVRRRPGRPRGRRAFCPWDAGWCLLPGVLAARAVRAACEPPAGTSPPGVCASRARRDSVATRPGRGAGHGSGPARSRAWARPLRHHAARQLPAGLPHPRPCLRQPGVVADRGTVSARRVVVGGPDGGDGMAGRWSGRGLRRWPADHPGPRRSGTAVRKRGTRGTTRERRAGRRLGTPWVRFVQQPPVKAGR